MHWYLGKALWLCSLREILEEFGWFGGMLEEFVRENTIPDEKKTDQAGFKGTRTGPYR